MYLIWCYFNYSYLYNILHKILKTAHPTYINIFIYIYLYFFSILPFLFLIFNIFILRSYVLKYFFLLNISIFMFSGGLGYSVIDVGLCLSSSSFVLLFAVDVFRVRLAYILKNSPIRAMRWMLKLLVLCCVGWGWVGLYNVVLYRIVLYCIVWSCIVF